MKNILWLKYKEIMNKKQKEEKLKKQERGLRFLELVHSRDIPEMLYEMYEGMNKGHCRYYLSDKFDYNNRKIYAIKYVLNLKWYTNRSGDAVYVDYNKRNVNKIETAIQKYNLKLEDK